MATCFSINVESGVDYHKESAQDAQTYPVLIVNALNFVGLAIAIITNVCLLFGSLRQNYFLVGFWLIFPLLITIGYPFAILGSIFNFGGYRQSTGSNSIIYAIFIYTLMLVVFLFCARLVYSYFKQLKKRHSNPEHSVVV
ncbi:uncharacterized protein LOC108594941 [Drosophila busckii]|uniref:uncharacterized protein LOC108594941 n=1 Tax=Drosophila busckii TaxID=30019 RepID=UPI00083F11D0|nr:uncharacterized protein LOC108594941 [Drosophila busckii]